MIKAIDSNISVEDAFSTSTEKKKIVARLVSDTKDETIQNGVDCTNIINLRPNYELDFGSTCMSADGGFGMLDSSGSWIF